MVEQSKGIRTEALDLGSDPSLDDPDFRMTYATADLEKQMTGVRSGRTEAVPWEEAKRGPCRSASRG